MINPRAYCASLLTQQSVVYIEQMTTTSQATQTPGWRSSNLRKSNCFLPLLTLCFQDCLDVTSLFCCFFPPCCCARKSKTKSIIRGMDISALYVYLSRSSQKSKEGPRTEKLPRDASTITSRTVLSPVPHLSPQYGSDSHARIKPTPAPQASDLFCDYNYGAAPLLCVCVWGGADIHF